MNRLLVTNVGMCPHCIGRLAASEIADRQMRHPLEAMLRRLVIVPPSELGMIGGMAFVHGVFERLDEIRASN
jgi:hypothetical protein